LVAGYHPAWSDQTLLCVNDVNDVNDVNQFRSQDNARIADVKKGE